MISLETQLQQCTFASLAILAFKHYLSLCPVLNRPQKSPCCWRLQPEEILTGGSSQVVYAHVFRSDTGHSTWAKSTGCSDSLPQCLTVASELFQKSDGRWHNKPAASVTLCSKWAWEKNLYMSCTVTKKKKNQPLASHFWHSLPKQDSGGTRGNVRGLPVGPQLWIWTLLGMLDLTKQHGQRGRCQPRVSMVAVKSHLASYSSVGEKCRNSSTTFYRYITDTSTHLTSVQHSIDYFTTNLIPDHICHYLPCFILYFSMRVFSRYLVKFGGICQWDVGVRRTFPYWQRCHFNVSSLSESLVCCETQWLQSRTLCSYTLCFLWLFSHDRHSQLCILLSQTLCDWSTYSMLSLHIYAP